MYQVPREVLEAPLQPVADSPTEKYYTDWRVYTERMGLPGSRELDPISVERREHWDCIADAARLPGPLPECQAVEAQGYEQDKPRVRERLALYHYYRSPKGARLLLGEEARVVLLLRGGDAYTGYTLRIETPPGSRARVDLVDTSILGGLKTYRIILAPGPGSVMEVGHLVLHSRKSAVYGIIEAEPGEGARLVYRAGGRPGGMTRIRLETVLAGEHSRLDAVLGYASSTGQRGDIIVNVTHRAPRTVSIVSGIGLARDNGRLVLRGIARVLRMAPGSATRVEMHVHVAGENAKGRSVPMLEIYTGDVEEASHSASASMIPEDVLFYAATRGLSPEEALLLIERGVLERPGVLDLAEALRLGL